MCLFTREELRDRNSSWNFILQILLHIISLLRISVLFLKALFPINEVFTYSVNLFPARKYFEFTFDRQCHKTSSPFHILTFLIVISKESFVTDSLLNLF